MSLSITIAMYNVPNVSQDRLGVKKNITEKMAMVGLGCSVKSCTFSKIGVDGTHGTRVFHWSLNS